jgi:hypothetical protein
VAKDVLHRGTAADHVGELVLQPELFPELRVLFSKRAHFKRLVGYREQMVKGKRLGDKVGRSGLHRLHRGFHGSERGDDDHGSS